MKNKSFEERRKKLSSLSDEALNKRFWDLTQKIVQPMIDMARTHTTPSIERSVLLRCGFSSLEAGKIVKLAFEKQLLGFGVGNLVLRLAKKRGLPYIEAGRLLAENEGWEDITYET